MHPGTTLGRARALEGALTRLKGIRKARVDVAREKDVSVEVLAVPERPEASVRREVEGLARTYLVDESLTSVNVLSAGNHARAGMGDRRRKLSSIVTRRTDERFSVQIILSREGDVVTGEAERPVGLEDGRVIAEAVLSGLDEIAPRSLRLQSVETLLVGEVTLVLVAVTFGQRLLLGTAEVHFDIADAVARATMHALNRSIAYAPVRREPRRG